MNDQTSDSGPLEPAETHETTAPADMPPGEAATDSTPAQPPAGVVPPARSAALSPAELWDQGVEEGQKRLDTLARETTQREWLLITRKLDRTRGEIGADPGLTMLALAWVKEKHEHGGASWDKLLDMTDAELEAVHGFPPGDRPED